MSCATTQLMGLASTLIACHCFGIFAGFARLLICIAADGVVRRFTLELIGIE
jgi:hypothetical protein